MRRRLALLGEQPSWVWPVARTALAAAAASGLFVLILAGIVIHSLPSEPAPEAAPAPAPTDPPPWLRRLLDPPPATPTQP